MEQAPRTGVPGPPAGAPEPSPADAPWGPAAETAPPDEVPEVAEAVGARALGLLRIAEELHGTVGATGHDLAGALRAHAGDVDALAEHLRDAGGGDPDDPDDLDAPGGPDDPDDADPDAAPRDLTPPAP